MKKVDVAAEIKIQHTRLLRFLNDGWILTHRTLPELRKLAELYGEKSPTQKVKVTLPGKEKLITVTRTGPELAQLFTSQCERGLYETGIVTTVSRVEAFIQECMVIAVSAYPRKLSVISEKSGIPLALFLEHENREDLLARYVAFRCQSLMFGKPSEYLEKACDILNIKLDQILIDTYIEIKATRDIIVHGSGKINQLYVEKAGKKCRGKVGDDLLINKKYAKHVFGLPSPWLLCLKARLNAYTGNLRRNIFDLVFTYFNKIFAISRNCVRARSK